MSDGIRATVEFDTSDICRIAELSAAAETTIDSVSRSVPVAAGSETVTEFSMDADAASEVDVEPIFSHGSDDRYRITHGDRVTCPCECLGQFGCPVTRYVARNGTLTVVFHAAEYDRLREVIAELRDQFPDVDIKRLLQSPAGDDSGDSVLVDRGRLTHRQLEVLATAYEEGYFDQPRRSNATEIAAELDITVSTFTEHLAAAESKILAELL
ncbi:MAG: helix-turn-helix domain-containing protein [Salinirussus sp.]